MANNKEKIEDFGKKIGGAKKDKWRSRGLDLSDISDWNAAEITKLVNKSNTWIKPNYEKIVESGIEKELAWFIKKTIDSLPVSTYVPYNANDEQILIEAKKYISFVNLVKEKVNSYKSFEDTKDFYDWVKETFLDHTGYAIKNEWTNISIGKLTSCAYNFKRNRAYMLKEMDKRKFCYSENEKIDVEFNKRFSFYSKENCKLREDNGKYSVRADDGSIFGISIFSIDKDQVELFNNAKSLYFDNKNGICFSDESLEDTKAKLRASFILDKPEVNRKKRFAYKPLDHIVRNGEEYRNKDASGDDFIKDMAFYGGEFGNWVSDKERQQNLNFAYDSFKDLGKALGFKDKDISLDKKLSIAFGARGAGKALAHYESLRQVINLTKLKGAGSLAHEYGHFLDHVINSYFYKNTTMKFLSEDYSTEADEKIPSKSDLIFAIKHKMATKDEQDEYRKINLLKIKNKDFLFFIKNKTNEDSNVYKDFCVLFDSLDAGENIDNVIKKFKEIKKELDNDYKLLYTIEHSKDPYAKDPKINNTQLGNLVWFLNKNTDYLINSLNQYYNTKNEDLSKLKINTKFYNDAMKMDNSYSGGYWSSTKEMFARAFACYIKDKLSELGIENTYLTGHADSGIGFDDNLNEILTYPVGEERKTINKAFDRFFEEVKVNVLGYEASKEFLDNLNHINEQKINENVNSKGEKTNMTAEELALIINDFSYDHDYYNYMDNYDNKEEGLEDMIQQLQEDPKKALSDFQSYYKDIISNIDDKDTLYKYNFIVDKINKYVDNENNSEAVFSFKTDDFNFSPVFSASREELKNAMRDLNWGNTPEDYFKIENGQYIFSNNYTIGAKEESIKKDLLSLQNKLIENRIKQKLINERFKIYKTKKRAEFYDRDDENVVVRLTEDGYAYSNFAICKNQYEKYKNSNYIVYDNLKKEYFTFTGEENSLNTKLNDIINMKNINLKESKKMEEKKYSSVEVVVPNRVGNNVVVGKVIKTEVEREVKGEKKVFKEHFRNYYVPIGKEGDLMHFTLRSKPKDFVPVGDYSVLSIPNFDEKGQKVEIGKFNAETKKFDVSETKHLSQNELSDAIKAAFNKINSDELGYLCLPKACFYDKTKDGKEYVDKNGKSFKMLSLPDYLPEPYKKAIMPVYQTLSHTTNDNLYVVKIEKEKPLNFKKNEENIEILGKEFLDINKKAFVEHINASKEMSKNLADSAGKEPSGKLNSHENIAKQQQAPEVAKNAKNNEKSHKNDGNGR